MIIDFSTHIITREVEKLLNSNKSFNRLQKNFESQSSDPEKRIELMEKYGIHMQVLTQTTPILIGLNEKEASEICKISNDEIGKICLSFPDKFIPFAVLSLLDVETAISELDRAINKWGCRGVTIGTNQNNKGLDYPEFDPFWKRICEHDIPVFLHPMHWGTYNLIEEDQALMRLFGWPFDTTQAIMRLVTSGTMERFPTLKIVSHHLGGGMLPFFSNRFNIKLEKLKTNLTRPVSESFERIYGDTAVDGSAAALPCGHSFFGTKRMLFGTDYPFSPENGEIYLRENLKIIREWELPEEEKAKILGDNARDLLKL